MAHLMLTGLLLASPSAPLFEYEDQLGLDDPARWMLTAPNQIPRNVRVTTKHNKIPDVASLSAWYTVLSMKARDVFYKIAQKDIECHPLKIMMRSGEYASDDYYFLSIKKSILNLTDPLF